MTEDDRKRAKRNVTLAIVHVVLVVVILAGFVDKEPDAFKLASDETFTKEPYGIGLAKDDTALRGKINDILQAAEDELAVGVHPRRLVVDVHAEVERGVRLGARAAYTHVWLHRDSRLRRVAARRPGQPRRGGGDAGRGGGFHREALRQGAAG